VKDKLPAAPMFTCARTGKPWTGHTWKRPITRAVQKTFAPGTKAYKRTTMYVLRHCSIADLVHAGVPPICEIAKLAGTSVVEIEKHYLHHLPSSGRNWPRWRVSQRSDP
jgi:hypothetical protein